MLVSETVLKWAMRLYPPFLFQGVWTQRFDKHYSGVHVKIFKSFINQNYNGSIFGGTIFSAADPWYLILFHQILIRKGYKVRLWLKHASIDYLKPGDCNLYIKLKISEENISEALHDLDTKGKFIKTFTVQITNKEGLIYAVVQNEIYIKKLKSFANVS